LSSFKSELITNLSPDLVLE